MLACSACASRQCDELSAPVPVQDNSRASPPCVVCAQAGGAAPCDACERLVLAGTRGTRPASSKRARTILTKALALSRRREPEPAIQLPASSCLTEALEYGSTRCVLSGCRALRASPGAGALPPKDQSKGLQAVQSEIGPPDQSAQKLVNTPRYGFERISRYGMSESSRTKEAFGIHQIVTCRCRGWHLPSGGWPASLAMLEISTSLTS